MARSLLDIAGAAVQRTALAELADRFAVVAADAATLQQG